MSNKQALLAVGLLCVGLGAAGVANASAIASATLEVNNFRWMVDRNGDTDFSSLAAYLATSGDDSPVQFDVTGSGAGDVVLVNTADNADISTTLTHRGSVLDQKQVTATRPRSGLLGPLDLPKQSAILDIAQPPGENDFTPDTYPATSTYAHGDQALAGAVIELIDGAGTVLQDAGADSGIRADASLSRRMEGTAQSNLSNSSTVQVAPLSDMQVYFEADYIAQTLAYLSHAEESMGFDAFARSGVNFNIALEEILTGDILMDEEVLDFRSNRISPIVGNADIEFEDSSSLDLGKYFSPKVSMLGGERYVLGISSEAVADGASAPEPGTLVLMATTILLLASVRHWRKA